MWNHITRICNGELPQKWVIVCREKERKMEKKNWYLYLRCRWKAIRCELSLLWYDLRAMTRGTISNVQVGEVETSSHDLCGAQKTQSSTSKWRASKSDTFLIISPSEYKDLTAKGLRIAKWLNENNKIPARPLHVTTNLNWLYERSY